MTGDHTNADRAYRGSLALQFYCKESPVKSHYVATDEVCDTDLADMLADLRHMCHRDGLDFDALVRHSLTHFEAELEEEKDE